MRMEPSVEGAMMCPASHIRYSAESAVRGSIRVARSAGPRHPRQPAHKRTPNSWNGSPRIGTISPDFETGRSAYMREK